VRGTASRLRRLPLATLTLIAADVIVYALSVGTGGSIVGGPSASTVVHYGAIPYELTHLSSHCDLAAAGFSQAVLCTGAPHVIGTLGSQPATWETVFTAIFLHANLLHLLVDLVFLALFAPRLEKALGSARLLLVYLLGGLAATAVTVAASPDSMVPTLAASGAVAAVLGGCLLRFPREPLGGTVATAASAGLARAPAWLLVAVWLALALVLGALGLNTRLGGGAATVLYAQAGGFAAGLLVVRALGR
jgi:membrane associated rhomboid family serine protease